VLCSECSDWTIVIQGGEVVRVSLRSYTHHLLSLALITPSSYPQACLECFSLSEMLVGRRSSHTSAPPLPDPHLNPSSLSSPPQSNRNNGQSPSSAYSVKSRQGSAAPSPFSMKVGLPPSSPAFCMVIGPDSDDESTIEPTETSQMRNDDSIITPSGVSDVGDDKEVSNYHDEDTACIIC
jgi:hypothetical protein